MFGGTSDPSGLTGAGAGSNFARSPSACMTQASLIRAEKDGIAWPANGRYRPRESPLNFVNNFAGMSVELLERRLKSGTAVRLRGGRAAVFSCSEND
jgi:hypothetical protein